MRSLWKSCSAIRSRAARAGVVLLALGVMPGCPACLDRSFTPTLATWESVAVVRNAEGIEVPVSAVGDGLFAGEPFVLAAANLESARSRFKRAINRRLMAGGDGLFQARFGTGPWCLVAEPSMALTLSRIRPEPPAETADELPICDGPPPPPQCNDAGADPRLEVDPPSFAFGDVPLGSATPATIPVTLSNAGTGYVCLASVVTSGRDALDFSVDDSDCRPANPDEARALLGAGARPSCQLLVTFNPTAPGPREGSLRVSSNDPQVLREFPLTGIGQAGALTPTGEFCVTRDTDGCFRRILTLTNTGPGAVTIRNFYADYAPDWPTLPYPLPCTPPVPVVLPAGGTISCPIESCLPMPDDEVLVLQSDGVGADPTATVLEIPVVAQVTPDTCTP